jgi:hypothetical protein
MRPYIIYLLMSFSITNLFAEPTVSWIKQPPETITAGQSFEVVWKVEGVDGSYHALCFLCPESDGQVCRKGPTRYDSQMFDSNDNNQYHYTFTLTQEVPEGRYYATPIAAHSRSDYHAGPSVLVSYHHSAEASADSSSHATTTPESSSSPSSSNNTTVVVPAVAPAYYWNEQEEEANSTPDGQTTTANQQQRQEAANQNQQQRQEAASSHNQSQHQHQRQSEHQRGGHSRGGRRS